MAQAEWWQSFFQDLYFSVQEQAAVQDPAAAEAGFIERVLRVTPGAQLLDVPCGAGRHAIELAARGYQITGVDLTAAALDAGRRAALVRGVGIEWHESDMRDLPWHERFHGAYCFFGSFGYFDDAGNQRFLEAVYATLRPGARFVLETHVAETILTRFHKQSWTRIGERLLLEERHYDHERGRIETDWTLISEGRSVQRRSSIRLYTYSELCQHFERAGFSVNEAFDTATGLPFQFHSARLSLVAIRGA